MSTPPRPSLRSSVALVWRTLRSMRTALILLLLVALASVAGSLLPQWPNTPDAALDYLRRHPVWGEVFLRLGFFDVFGSWWFALIIVLLFVSLVACLLPRTRAHVRAMRQRPIQAREIDAFRHVAERRVALAPEQAVGASRRVLRRRGFRVARDPAGAALAAEKGMLRELGSLVFHWAFVLLLIGVIVGKGTGYAGRALIVEGESWTDALANYDGSARSGRFFGGDFSDIRVHLVDYRDSFGATGVPMDFQSEVELESPDGQRRTEVIRVNHPAVFEGVRLFQFGFGWAPVVEVADEEGIVRSGSIPFDQTTAPEGVSQLAVPWHGFVKIPTTDPPTAVELTLWPDSRSLLAALRDGEPTPMVTRFDPVMQYAVWRGPLPDLSLTRAPDTTQMRRLTDGVIGAGQTVDLERGCVVSEGAGPALGSTCDAGAEPTLTMAFPDLKQFTVLQVSRDRTIPVVLLAAILILIGLLPALYTSRRKVWVRARADAEGTVLQVGGFALQRKTQFEQEFTKLVDALTAASGGTAAPEREMVGT